MNKNTPTKPDGCSPSEMPEIAESFTQKAKELCRKLSSSPIFAMSLGSKELFHTNFLAFILTYQLSKSVASNLKVLLFGKDFNDEIFVFREKKNLDLVIVRMFSNENAKDDVSDEILAVIIEAKMKSIPTFSQLEKYSQKICKGIEFFLDDADARPVHNGDTATKLKILAKENYTDTVDIYYYDSDLKTINSLSKHGKCRKILLGPAGFKKENRPNDWDFIDWLKISTQLAAGNNNLEQLNTDQIISHDESFFHRVVETYSKDLETVMNVLDEVERIVRYDSDLKVGILNCIVKGDALKHARIYDLVSKYAYVCLVRLLSKRNEQIQNCNNCIFFSRSSPGFNMYCEKDTEEGTFHVGVQVQQGKYRHYIENSKEKRLEATMFKRVVEDHISLWFQIVDPEVEYFGAGNKHDKKRLMKFGEYTFRYAEKDCRHISFEELTKDIMKSLQKAKEICLKTL